MAAAVVGPDPPSVPRSVTEYRDGPAYAGVAAAAAIAFSGCAQVAAILDPQLAEIDRERLHFVEPIIGEHVERHPEQKQAP